MLIVARRRVCQLHGQIRFNTDGWRIVNVLRALLAFSNDLAVQIRQGMFRDKVVKKIIRCGAGFVLSDAHPKARTENQ